MIMTDPMKAQRKRKTKPKKKNGQKTEPSTECEEMHGL